MMGHETSGEQRCKVMGPGWDPKSQPQAQRQMTAPQGPAPAMCSVPVVRRELLVCEEV